MALTIDYLTKVISVPQADLTFVSGALYELDTNQFRKDVMDILAAENHIWMEDAFQHNTDVTVAGTTFARTIEFINGYSVTFEDTGGAYSIRLVGSNNNIFDVENGILNPTALTTVIPTNSAGLISGSMSIDDLENIILEGTESMAETLRILRAAAAGSIVEQTDGSYVIKSRDGGTDRIIGDDAANGGRTVSATDGT